MTVAEFENEFGRLVAHEFCNPSKVVVASCERFSYPSCESC